MRRLWMCALLVSGCTVLVGERRGSFSASTSSISIAPATVIANGAATATITVVVKDANGVVQPGYTIVFSATGSNNVFAPATGSTDPSGVFAATLRSTTAEMKTVTATVAGTTLQRDVLFVSDAPAMANSTLQLAPTSVTADGVATATVTVTAIDANGNHAAGQTVALSADGSDNSFASSTGTTDASGIFATTLTSTKAEVKTVSALIGNGFLLQEPITFVPGPPSATASTVSASPTTVYLDGTSDITITSRDAYGNPVPNQMVSVTAGAGTTCTPASGMTDGNGQLVSQLSATTSGSKTVVASLGGTPIPQQPTVLFATCTAPTAITPNGAATSGTTAGASDQYAPVCAQPTDGPDRTYTFALGAASSVLVDRSTSFANAVSQLRPRSALCSSDSDNYGCTTDRYLFCPTVPAGDYDVLIDGISGAQGSYTVQVSTGSSQPEHTYGVITTAPTFSTIDGASGLISLMTSAKTSNNVPPRSGQTATTTLPFDFSYFGKSYPSGTNLTVYESGYVSFGPTAINTVQNECIAPGGSSSVPPDTIMPYWGRLAFYQSGSLAIGKVIAVTQGTVGSRTFTVEWKDMDGVPSGSPPIDDFECVQYSVQMILYEATGQIEFRYAPYQEDQCGAGTTNDPYFSIGGHQTIGLQSGPTTLLVQQMSCHTSPGPGTAEVGTCVAGSPYPDNCSATKGYLFVPASASCP